MFTREWRNWQTRTFEGRVDFPYGFKSRLSHQSECSFHVGGAWRMPTLFFCCRKRGHHKLTFSDFIILHYTAVQDYTAAQNYTAVRIIQPCGLYSRAGKTLPYFYPANTELFPKAVPSPQQKFLLPYVPYPKTRCRTLPVSPSGAFLFSESGRSYSVSKPFRKDGESHAILHLTCRKTSAILLQTGKIFPGKRGFAKPRRK